MNCNGHIFVLGPADSGKSLFVKNFSEYLISEGYKVGLVSLDPEVLNLNYKPDFGIKKIFAIASIMREKNMGSNGAILEAMDRLAKVGVPKFESADYILFDTPSQLEPFLFRKLEEK